jgi:hypothetical protein
VTLTLVDLGSTKYRTPGSWLGKFPPHTGGDTNFAMRYEDQYTYVGPSFKLDVLSKMPCDASMKYRVEVLFSLAQARSNGAIEAGAWHSGGVAIDPTLNRREVTFVAQLLDVSGASPYPMITDPFEDVEKKLPDALRKKGLWVSDNRLNGVRVLEVNPRKAPVERGNRVVGKNPHTCWKNLASLKRKTYGTNGDSGGRGTDPPVLECTSDCVASEGCRYAQHKAQLRNRAMFQRRRFQHREVSVGNTCIFAEKYCPIAQVPHVATPFGSVVKPISKTAPLTLTPTATG